MNSFSTFFFSALIFLVQSSLWISPSRAEDPIPELSPLPTSEPAPEASSEKGSEPSDEENYKNLPQIEAKTYEIKSIKMSSSQKVVLFDDLEQRTPRNGRIVLVRKDDLPIRAFRVLKYYPLRKQFAARIVRGYDEKRPLELGTNFLAVEKLADITEEDLPAPPLSDEDKKDIKEIEEDLPAPPETGEVLLPKPKPNLKDSLDDENDEEEAAKLTLDDIVMKEVKRFDQYNHAFSLEFGFIENLSSGGKVSYFSGAGLRYGLTLAHRVFIREVGLQDAIILEPGAFYYKAMNYAETGDAYSVSAFTGNVRYTLNLNEEFGVFFYFGVLKNVATATLESSTDYTDSTHLGSTLPTGGGGLFFRLGPGWFGRLDLGVDFMGGGIMLRL